MNNEILHFGRNPAGGRDLIVGDIHGCFSKLHAALLAVDFDGAHDRLFSVGDLVDRGPESAMAEVWLRQPWFFAVRGNHEEAAFHFADGGLGKREYIGAFGGGWNADNEPAERKRIGALLAGLPLGIELDTEHGLVGILHADCPTPTWAELKKRLAGGGMGAEMLAGCCTWSRDRLERLNDTPVGDMRAVVVGHSPMDAAQQLGNVYYIDTFGWRHGKFTLLNAATMRPAEPLPARALDWIGT
jgi:serine/threonine protein phosphatase 1